MTDNLPAEMFAEPVRHEWVLMAEMRAAQPNVRAKELANSLGFNYHTILRWSKDPSYLRYENWLMKKEVQAAVPQSDRPKTSIQDTLAAYSADMLGGLIDIFEHTSDDKLAAAIAQDFLDRAGHAPKSKEAQRPFVLNIGSDVAEMFFRRAQEVGMENVLLGDGHTLNQSNP